MRIKSGGGSVVERHGGEQTDLSTRVTQRFGNFRDAVLIDIHAEIAVDGFLSGRDCRCGRCRVRHLSDDIRGFYAALHGKIEKMKWIATAGCQRF